MYINTAYFLVWQKKGKSKKENKMALNAYRIGINLIIDKNKKINIEKKMHTKLY